MIIALSPFWQGNASPGPYCGRKIQITNTGGGQSNNGVGRVIVATVKDTCPGCGENDLGGPRSFCVLVEEKKLSLV